MVIRILVPPGACVMRLAKVAFDVTTSMKTLADLFSTPPFMINVNCSFISLLLA